MNKFGSFIFGILAGALVGGGLALLLTPLKGSDVRTRLGNSFVHVQDEVKNAAQNRITELNQQLSRLQNKASD
jgi:gas vesicle protein